MDELTFSRMDKVLQNKQTLPRKRKHEYLTCLAHGLQEQWSNANFTDTKIIVGDRTFECHRVVLSAISEYFQRMYLSGMKESQNGEVHLQDVESETFESILKFVYTGEDIVHNGNVDDVLRVADMLQIKCLRERCEAYMLENVDYENCLQLWTLASSHNCDLLTQKARSYALYYFTELWKTEEFLHLDIDDLLSLIIDNDLKTPNEELVCEAVLRWLDFKTDQRKQHVKKLMENLRLPLMQPEYLLSTIDNNSLLIEDHDCHKYIEEAKRYHLLPARRHEFVSARLIHRNHGNYEEVVICIGGNPHPEQTSREVTCYSLRAKEWLALTPLPFSVGVEFAVCAYGNALFISGGSEALHGMMYYLTTQNAWLECSQMIVGRRRHSMVAVGDSLYILGGYDDEETDDRFSTLMSVEKFGVSSGTWEECGYMTFPVRSASASVVQDKIYIFGGINGEGDKVNIIQCFDTRIRQCSLLDKYLPLSGMCSTVVCNTTTYLLFPNGSVLRMEADGQVDPVGTISHFERCGFGTIQHNGEILIFGGIDSSDMYDDIVSYNPLTGSSHVEQQKMFRPLFGFGCVKMTVSKCFFQ